MTDIGICKTCGRPLPEEKDEEYCSRRCRDNEQRKTKPLKNAGKK